MSKFFDRTPSFISISITLLGTLLIAQNIFYLSINSSVEQSTDFNFVAAGDWSCDEQAKTTSNNMIATNPELILALGDLSYTKTGDCWLNIAKPFGDKMKIVLGNHDVAEGAPKSLPIQYEKSYHLDSTFYSFNQQNVHFLIMNSEIPFDKNTPQFSFVNSDLSKASSDSNIKWIIVSFHSPMYTSKSHHTALTDLRDIYHPLFDKYGVDLVLQGHNHNYQRSFPIKFNSQTPSNPIISDSSKNTYNSPDGEIYVIAGTGGRGIYPLENKESFISNQYEGYGFLEIQFNKDLTRLHGIFHSNDGNKIIDEFWIQKDHAKVIPIHTPTPQKMLKNN